MSNIKQVYATLKIDDGDLQILVAEYYNTRFNIINTYSCEALGVNEYKIVNEEEFVKCLKDAVDVVSNKIGARLEKVILVLPPYNFKRTSLRVSLIPNGSTIRKKDVARAITNALKTDIDDSLMVINASVIKYTINGISYRRLPENETCEEALIDIDLLCADKEMAVSYVEAIYKANLEVLDLCLSNYAISKESVSLENSISKNIILLDIVKNYTYLTLLSKGKLLQSDIIFEGFNTMCQAFYNKYHLPMDTISRLIKYNVNFDETELDKTILAYSDNDVQKPLTVRELNEFIKPYLDSYIDKLLQACKPIMEMGADFIVCGEGSQMLALVDKLKRDSNCDVKTYYPDAIGVRNTNLCANYGALFVYKEKANLNELSVNCVNIAEYDKVVDQIEEDVEGESITTKIKNLFEMYKNRED